MTLHSVSNRDGFFNNIVPTATINKQHRLTFNAATVREYGLKQKECVSVLFDDELLYVFLRFHDVRVSQQFVLCCSNTRHPTYNINFRPVVDLIKQHTLVDYTKMTKYEIHEFEGERVGLSKGDWKYIDLSQPLQKNFLNTEVVETTPSD